MKTWDVPISSNFNYEKAKKNMGFRDLGIFTHKHWGLTNNAPRDFSDLSNKSGFNCNKRVYIYTHIVKGFIMIYLSLLSYKGYSEGIYLIIRGLLTYK
jgi:hypothetical protein